MAILKDRMVKAGPIWRRLVRRAFGVENKGFVMQQGIAGGIAGNIAMTKIKANDHLVSVLAVPDSPAVAGASVGVDLTSEFSILSDGIIDNTGGTATTDFLVIATWEAFDDE